jgi:hypothetical protein
MATYVLVHGGAHGGWCYRYLWDIDTGHDLMITEPQAVADLLLRLA